MEEPEPPNSPIELHVSIDNINPKQRVNIMSLDSKDPSSLNQEKAENSFQKACTEDMKAAANVYAIAFYFTLPALLPTYLPTRFLTSLQCVSRGLQNKLLLFRCLLLYRDCYLVKDGEYHEPHGPDTKSDHNFRHSRRIRKNLA